MTHRRAFTLSSLALLLTSACAKAQNREKDKPSGPLPYKITVVAEGLEFPWGMAVLPDSDILVTEKSGQLQRVNIGKKTLISGAPEVDYNGQGGLLDVALDPEYADNGFVYLSFSEKDDTGANGTAVFKAKLSGNALIDGQVIWRQTPKIKSGAHFGSRLAFAPDKTLFITTGDRFSQRDQAQKLDNTVGKVIRINRDGSIPADNPFLQTAGAKPEIWSYGHRNMQGAFVHPETGALWSMEHGPQGGDEINLDQAGKNYGWPVITYGENYDGTYIGPKAKDGMEQPLHYWVPSIAPSGMMFYTGDAFPQWKGRLFVGSLKFQYLNMLTLDGTKILAEEKLLTEVGERVRDVAQGHDGFIYVCFDQDDGRVIRLEPGYLD